jgi:alkyl hydroperoxide reductase subunit AhpC
MLQFRQETQRSYFMSKDYTKVLTEILITLANINDKLRKIETKITETPTEPQVFKHIVVNKPYKEKGEENGKISR